MRPSPIVLALILLPAVAVAQYPAPPPAPEPPRQSPAPAPRSSPPPATSPKRLPDPPAYPRYVPPQPEPRPDPPVGRRMGQRASVQPGLLLSAGLHRDLSAGAELQLRLSRNVGVGLGGQIGAAFGEEVTCPTYGGTGRLYIGRDQRFVAEGGFGRNRIDPYLNARPGRRASCDGGEVNYGPEAALGYQSVSRGGFVFEALAGLVFLTNEAMADAHGVVAPAFQLKIGYLIH